MRPVDYPRLITTRTTRISPWVDLVEKSVQFAPDEMPRVYHCLTQPDYVGVLAVTPDGRVPIVRQYPALRRGFHMGVPRRDGGRLAKLRGRGPARVEWRRQDFDVEQLDLLGLLPAGYWPASGALTCIFCKDLLRNRSDCGTRESGIETRLVTRPELRR